MLNSAATLSISMNYNIYPMKERKTTKTYWKAQSRPFYLHCCFPLRLLTNAPSSDTHTHTCIRAEFKRWAKEERVFVYILEKKRRTKKINANIMIGWSFLMCVPCKGKFEVNRIIYFVHLTSTDFIFPLLR